MDEITQGHLDRLRTAVLKRYTAGMTAKWVVDHTFLGGRPYSFHNHEFQEEILNSEEQETNTQKCSQVGMSEAQARKALARVSMLTPYTVAYTLPTAKFAGTFAKTRIDPIIEGSPTLKQTVHKTNNNNEVKQFGDSFFWIRGAASSNAPISIPCDHLIHDEVDFSDQEVLGQYRSRLTHSAWRNVDRISTPTLPNFGINKYFRASRRKFLFCKCEHCNEQFIPDYYKHVKIPGYLDDLRRIDKAILSRIRWKEAKVHCPRCGKVPSLQKEHREWVFENPDDNFKAIGHQVSPFDAPFVVTAADLVEASTEYDRIQDFENFSLGLPSDDKEATLTREDFESLFVRTPVPTSAVFVMGVDVGNVYHFVIDAVDAWGSLLRVHSEKVPMGMARTRYHELRREFRVICTVMDSGPHSETVMALQEQDPNMYAAVYMRSKSVVTHTVIEKEKIEEEGQDFVRQVNVNRNKAFDAYMEAIRSNKIHFIDSDLQEETIQHHTSMKRVRVFDNDSGEMTFSWQKSDGVDHFHHAGLYSWVAARIKGLGKSLIILPTFQAFKFKVKQY